MAPRRGPRPSSTGSHMRRIGRLHDNGHWSPEKKKPKASSTGSGRQRVGGHHDDCLHEETQGELLRLAQAAQRWSPRGWSTTMDSTPRVSGKGLRTSSMGPPRQRVGGFHDDGLQEGARGKLHRLAQAAHRCSPRRWSLRRGPGRAPQARRGIHEAAQGELLRLAQAAHGRSPRRWSPRRGPGCGARTGIASVISTPLGSAKKPSAEIR